MNYALLLSGNFVSLFTTLFVAFLYNADFLGEFSAKYSILIICSSIADYGLSAIGPRIAWDCKNEAGVINSLLVVQVLMACCLMAVALTFKNFFHTDIIIAALAGALVGCTPVWLLLIKEFVRESYFVYLVQKAALAVIVVLCASEAITVDEIYQRYIYLLALVMMYVLLRAFSLGFINFSSGFNFKTSILKSKDYFFQHITGYVTNNINQFLVYKFIGPYSSALYAVADRMAKPIVVLMSPFRNYMLNNRLNQFSLMAIEKFLLGFSVGLYAITIIVYFLLSKRGYLNEYPFGAICWFVLLFSVNNLILVLIEANITLKIYINSHDATLTRFFATINILTLFVILVVISQKSVAILISALIAINLLSLIYVRNKKMV